MLYPEMSETCTFWWRNNYKNLLPLIFFLLIPKMCIYLLQVESLGQLYLVLEFYLILWIFNVILLTYVSFLP